MAEPGNRAADPGVRLHQINDPKWVHCPRCQGPARESGERLSCTKCGHSEGGPKPNRRRMRELMIAKWSPKCPNPKCGAPVPEVGRAVRGGGSDEELVAEVKCPTCGRVGRHKAVAMSPNDLFKDRRRFWSSFYGGGRSLYLARRIGSHTLVVYNRAHLDALEQWLGADLRERGPEAGLTMMARLPRWMKAASARPKVMKALAEIREQMVREGLD